MKPLIIRSCETARRNPNQEECDNWLATVTYRHIAFSYRLQRPTGMPKAQFADNRATSLPPPALGFVTTPSSEILDALRRRNRHARFFEGHRHENDLHPPDSFLR